MAIRLQWLDLSLGLHGAMSQGHLMPFGIFTNCPTEKAKSLQMLLSLFCIATSQSMPIFEEGPPPSG